jgi:hypothetical protein
MQSLRTGLAFFKQAWGVARHDPQCYKPAIFSLAAGLVVTLLLLIPIGVVVAYLRRTIPGILLIGILGGLLLFAQLACGELSALVIAYRFHRHFVQTDGEAEKALVLLRRSGLDWLIFVTASPVVKFQLWQKQRQPNGISPGEAWRQATFLLMPLVVIEKLNLKDSLGRITQLLDQKMLKSNDRIFGVYAVNWLVYAVLGIVAAVIGLVVARTIHGVTGACLAIFLASLFSLLAITWTAFNRAAYQTCLYGLTRIYETTSQGNPSGETWAQDMQAAVLNQAVH